MMNLHAHGNIERPSIGFATCAYRKASSYCELFKRSVDRDFGGETRTSKDEAVTC